MSISISVIFILSICFFYISSILSCAIKNYMALHDSQFWWPFTIEFTALLSSLGAIHNSVESQGVTEAKREGNAPHLHSDTLKRASRALNQTDYDRAEELQKEWRTQRNHSCSLLSPLSQHCTGLMKSPDFADFLASQHGSPSLIFCSHILLNSPIPPLVNFSQAEPQLPCSIDQSLHRCIHSLHPLARLLGSCGLPLPCREFWPSVNGAPPMKCSFNSLLVWTLPWDGHAPSRRVKSFGIVL